jgi:transposase
MGSITRSGSEILRRYFIHGARTTLMHAKKAKVPPRDRNRIWAMKLEAKVGMNKATVALAHRMCRIAFAIVRDGKPYDEKLKHPLLRSEQEKVPKKEVA